MNRLRFVALFVAGLCISGSAQEQYRPGAGVVRPKVVGPVSVEALGPEQTRVTIVTGVESGSAMTFHLESAKVTFGYDKDGMTIESFQPATWKAVASVSKTVYERGVKIVVTPEAKLAFYPK